MKLSPDITFIIILMCLDIHTTFVKALNDEIEKLLSVIVLYDISLYFCRTSGTYVEERVARPCCCIKVCL